MPVSGLAGATAPSIADPTKAESSRSKEDTLAGKRFAQGTPPSGREPDPPLSPQAPVKVTVESPDAERARTKVPPRRVSRDPQPERRERGPAAPVGQPARQSPKAPAVARSQRAGRLSLAAGRSKQPGRPVKDVHLARRIVAGGLVALLGLVGVTAALKPSRAGGAVAATSATPLLSIRRFPTALGGVVADRQLASEVRALLSDPAVSSDPSAMCLVVRVNGRRIVNINPDTPLVPASNMKVLTALAALSRLGTTERLRTVVRGPAPASGLVNGDIFLVGGGDPYLAVSDYADKYAAVRAEPPRKYSSLDALADAVAATGALLVAGSVVGDESRYDSVRYGTTWKSSYATLGEVGPQSALSVNQGFATYFPNVVAADSPPENAAAVFTSLLEARGVSVAGPPRAGKATGTTELAVLDSFPMGELVGEMMRHSDNLAAELLLKEMGAQATGQQGTTASGLAAMFEALSGLGLNSAAITTVDGSGLDRSDRATCGVLAAAVETGGRGSALDQAMPVAGVSGTLEKRFLGNPAQGRLRAKTGSLSGVSALTGFVDAVSGVPITFSFITNTTPSDAAGKAFQERLGSVLTNAPAPADLTSVAPPG